MSKDYFFCYNKRLATFIKENNIKQITVAQDLESKKIFTLFEATPELQVVIAKYKSMPKEYKYL